jgi:hypothetical protein
MANFHICAPMLRSGGAFFPQQRLYLAPERQGQRALRGVAAGGLQNELPAEAAWAGLQNELAAGFAAVGFSAVAGADAGGLQNELLARMDWAADLTAWRVSVTPRSVGTSPPGKFREKGASAKPEAGSRRH